VPPPGERGTTIETWPPARLGQVRRWEAAAAMAILGVTEHRWLGYPDGELAELDPEQPIDRLADILAESVTLAFSGRTTLTRPQTIISIESDALDGPASRILPPSLPRTTCLGPVRWPRNCERPLGAAGTAVRVHWRARSTEDHRLVMHTRPCRRSLLVGNHRGSSRGPAVAAPLVAPRRHGSPSQDSAHSGWGRPAAVWSACRGDRPTSARASPPKK
jgi:hypothetical protein